MKKKGPSRKKRTIAKCGSPAEIEKKKRAKMRQAVTIANGGNKLGGVEKTHRHKPKTVTLPDPERVKRILDRED